MFELNQKYKCGGAAFFFLFIKYAWWLTLVGAGFIYLAYEMYFGRLRDSVTNFLALHNDWYIDTFMISEWVLLLGLSVLFVGYLRATAMHRSYKFMLDEHAFHLRRGLFFIHETTIPYLQISKVTISRPYHYRFLGIAELDIITADDRSDSNNKVRANKFLVPTISASLARALSKQLLTYAAMSRKGQDIEPQYEDEEEFEDDTTEESDENIDRKE